MSSKKGNRGLLRTVKFRVAIWYVVLFSFSSILFFSIIYVFLSVNITEQMDEKLLVASSNLEYFYLKGESYGDKELLAPNIHIPDNIAAIGAGVVRGFKIVHSETVMVDGKLLYEITGVAGDKICEIKIDRDEKVVDIRKREKNGLDLLENGFIAESLREGTKTIYICLLTPEGRILATSDLSHWPGLRDRKSLALPAAGEQPRFRTAEIAGVSNKVRICDRKIFDGNILEIGIRLSYEERLLKTYSNIFISVFLCSIVVGSAVGWFVARKSMAGVDRVSAAALNIGQGDFSGSVPYGNEGEEIRNLVSAFNEMISRTRSLITQLREVTDNIAHDLRTPITRIRGMVETTVTSDQTVENYREMAGGVVEECDRLIGMINTMLDITAVNSGMAALSREKVDVNDLLGKTYSLFTPLADMKDLDFILDLPKEPVLVSGDLPHLQRMISNIVDNAIKYTPEKGRVFLALDRDANSARIVVRDTGCGIAPEDKGHIFDRFYRGDSSRSQPGNGLGLSLAIAVARAHKGDIAVESSSSTGSTFTVRLPAI